MYKIIKRCRVCESTNLKSILNLGKQPPANSLQKKISYQLKVPLNLLRCSSCLTLQLSATISPDYLFSKYLWVTRTSDSIKKYRDYFVKKIKSFHNVKKRKLLEIASNDGFFLEEFKRNKFQVLGVDPAKNIVKNVKKIKTISKFFNTNVADTIKTRYFSPNIVICRNVIPHVENIHDVIEGISRVLSDDGKAYIEFHYAENLNKNLHYDYIYHEHIFYFTLLTITNILKKHGLYSIDYFKSPISGGSIVLIASKKELNKSNILKKLILYERKNKINSLIYWKSFKKKCQRHRLILNQQIKNLTKNKKKIAGYGASARSSTLLNYCKINNNQLKVIFDKNIMKNNLYTAGSNIIIKQPKLDLISNYDAILILAWNFKEEIIAFLRKMNFKKTIITVLPRIKIKNVN